MTWGKDSMEAGVSLERVLELEAPLMKRNMAFKITAREK